jgi:dipeptidase
VFNLLAPSISLPPYTTPYQDDYPFSVPLESMLTPEGSKASYENCNFTNIILIDLMRVQRDHYEGTEFDLTKGLAAGPYGDPNRFDPAPQPSDNLTMVDIIEGSYERAISLFRTSYSFVAQSRNISDTLGLLWFGPYAPSSTSYAPIYIHSNILPASYTRGSLFNYDPLVSFWSHLAASNYASRFYKFAFVDVQQLQKNLFDDSLYETRYTEAKANKILSATTVNYPGGSTFSFADSAGI